MPRNHLFAVVTRLVAATVVMAAFSGPCARSAYAGDTKTKSVKLELEQGFGGAPRIMINPPWAKIWRNKPGKAQTIRWFMLKNRTSYYEVFWEFRYDPSKKGATADYFGEVDLECGETGVEASPKMKPDSPQAEWPYSITAYACANGVKAQKIATVNARIIWKD